MRHFILATRRVRAPASVPDFLCGEHAGLWLHCADAVQRLWGPKRSVSGPRMGDFRDALRTLAVARRPPSGTPLLSLGAKDPQSWGALSRILRPTSSTCQTAPSSWADGTRWIATLLATSRYGSRVCSSRLVGRKISLRQTCPLFRGLDERQFVEEVRKLGMVGGLRIFCGWDGVPRRYVV